MRAAPPAARSLAAPMALLATALLAGCLAAAAPPGEGLHPDLRVEVDPVPRLLQGQHVEFHAHVTGPTAERAHVAWRLERMGDGEGTTKWTATGPDWLVPGLKPGAYSLRAELVGPDGLTGIHDSATILVDHSFTGSGSCASGLAPLRIADLCEGVEGAVEGGHYRISAAVGGSAVHGTLQQCAELVVYVDGKRVAAGPANQAYDGEVSAYVTVKAKHAAFEVRWEPSAATGEPVDYAVAIVSFDRATDPVPPPAPPAWLCT